MGNDCLTIEDAEDAFNYKFDVHPEARVIPPVPFSPEDLEKAKSLGQFLIFHESSIDDGLIPITMDEMMGLTGGKLKDGSDVFSSRGQEHGQPFYDEETPRKGWTLASKSLTPGSTGQDYLQQTEQAIQYIESQVYAGRPTPSAYQEAIAEFNDQKAELSNALADSKTAEKLAGLKITQLIRPNAAETLYDFIVYFHKNSEHLLGSGFTWTTSVDSNGAFVRMGDSNTKFGMDCLKSKPDQSLINLGLSLSRRS